MLVDRGGGPGAPVPSYELRSVLAGEYRVVTEDEDGGCALTERKVIARRAAEELGENDVWQPGLRHAGRCGGPW